MAASGSACTFARVLTNSLSPVPPAIKYIQRSMDILQTEPRNVSSSTSGNAARALAAHGAWVRASNSGHASTSSKAKGVMRMPPPYSTS